MHPRISLHQVAFINHSNSVFIEHCHAIGIQNATLVSPLLESASQLQEVKEAIAKHPINVSAINHVFSSNLDQQNEQSEATQSLLELLDKADQLGANTIYLLTGGRGNMDWESAASNFAKLIAPCAEKANKKEIQLLVENASGFNADIHIAHTLEDTSLLADKADIGVCIELHACWFEAQLKQKIHKAIPNTGLVQVSDYVLGDRIAPCRAVPGDGVIPLEPILGDILEAGYTGLFDIELVGARIEQEGAHTATQRACEYLSELLIKLGA